MKILLLLLCFIETMLITYWINYYGPFVSPVVLFLVSSAIAIIFLHIANRSHHTGPTKLPLSNKYIKYVSAVLFFALCGFIAYKQNLINREYPLEIETLGSDVIPSIVLFAKRCIAGEFPYTIMHFMHHSVSPTYLTFTWLPFCIAELLHFDYRWVAILVFLAVSFYLFYTSFRSSFRFPTFFEKLIVGVWPLIVWICVATDDKYLMASTVEALIAAYYLLLALATQHKKIGLLSIAAGLCLLSRYSILFWMPLCFFLLVVSGKKKEAFLLTGIVVAFILVFYVFPFLTRDPYIFMKGYQYYTQAALGEWGVAANENGFWHIGNGLGFTQWMFSGKPSIPWEKRLFIYQKIHIIASLLTVTLLFIIYMIRKRYTLNSYLLFSMKIYLTVFYAFIQVPYKYLFLVPVMVSSALLLSAYRKQSASQHFS